jgi:hypothetical protein
VGNDRVVRAPGADRKLKVRKSYPPMASGQRDGITILLGLKWYEVGEISEDGKGIELLRAYSRVTRQAEQEALWQLKEQSFSQVRRRLSFWITSSSTSNRAMEGAHLKSF